MTHDHNHTHSSTLKKVNNAFITGIILNTAFVIIQLFYGITAHSLSLIADAGHNFADVASLLLSLIAFKLHKVKATQKYTYGYRKTSVLVALANAVILLISIGIIFYEAVIHLLHPVALQGSTVALVALAGVFVNGISALFFFRNKEHDLNIKSAFLHLAADALISFGIVIGGIIIYYTGWYRTDAIISMVIALVILYSTWKLLIDSIQLSVDGVPHHIDINALQRAAMEIKGIINLHHLHVWALSTTENALTVHVLLDNNVDISKEQQIKEELRSKFRQLNIHHITLETERSADSCGQNDCDDCI